MALRNEEIKIRTNINKIKLKKIWKLKRYEQFGQIKRIKI